VVASVIIQIKRDQIPKGSEVGFDKKKASLFREAFAFIRRIIFIRNQIPLQNTILVFL
jgi:hypothetical protein